MYRIDDRKFLGAKPRNDRLGGSKATVSRFGRSSSQICPARISAIVRFANRSAAAMARRSLSNFSRSFLRCCRSRGVRGLLPIILPIVSLILWLLSYWFRVIDRSRTHNSTATLVRPGNASSPRKDSPACALRCCRMGRQQRPSSGEDLTSFTVAST
jgi:hypothetical protein